MTAGSKQQSSERDSFRNGSVRTGPAFDVARFELLVGVGTPRRKAACTFEDSRFRIAAVIDRLRFVTGGGPLTAGNAASDCLCALIVSLERVIAAWELHNLSDIEAQ